MKKIYNFLNSNYIPPYNAKYVIIKNDKDEIIGKIPVSNVKPEYGKRLYRFGVLSDVHFNEAGNDYHDEINLTTRNDSINDFKNAVNFLNKKESISFTCICGDICCNNATEPQHIKDLNDYKTTVDNYSPNTPVYTCTGNHDNNYSKDIYDPSFTFTDLDGSTITALDAWKKYTGMPDVSYHFQHKVENVTDNFYFLSMRQFYLGATGEIFKDEDINNLEEFLEEHKNERTFIFTHTPFPLRAGIFAHSYNSGSYWLGGKYLKRLTDLSYKYKNTLWFSGHSHYEWACQGIQKEYFSETNTSKQVYNFKERNFDANIWPANQDHDRECGWALHIPSCSGVRPIGNAMGSTYGPTNWKVYGTSEFAIVDVYENYIDFRGVSLIGQDQINEGKLYYNPIAQYRLDTTIKSDETKYYELKSLTFNDFENMNIGESKPICISCVGYDSYKVGSVEYEHKNANTHNSFNSSKYGSTSSITYTNANTNCDLNYIDENDDRYKRHYHHECQLHAEMRDFVNMKPKQYTFHIHKTQDGFYITNSYGKKLYRDNNDFYWTDDILTYFNISNNIERQATSSLVSQTNNPKLLRLNIKDTNLYMKIENSLKVTNYDDGWSRLYIYEIYRA